MRDPKHAAVETAALKNLLAAHPAFAMEVSGFRSVDDDFPDIVVTLTNGNEVDFEITEWIHLEQMVIAKRLERLEKNILDAIGPQSSNASQFVHLVMLSPRPGVGRFEESDAPLFRKAIWELVTDTETRWPQERMWHNPQGRYLRDELASIPILGKYLLSVHFDPVVVGGDRKKPWPAGEPWIVFEGAGGSYNSDPAIAALVSVVEEKVKHYGGLTRPVRLLVHYGQAALYNTPYHGPNTELADIAMITARAVAAQTIFERIYVLSGLMDGAEAYEIFPACTRCT